MRHLCVFWYITKTFFKHFSVLLYKHIIFDRKIPRLLLKAVTSKTTVMKYVVLSYQCGFYTTEGEKRIESNSIVKNIYFF